MRQLTPMEVSTVEVLKGTYINLFSSTEDDLETKKEINKTKMLILKSIQKLIKG